MVLVSNHTSVYKFFVGVVMREKYILLQNYVYKYKQYAVVSCAVGLIIFLGLSLASFHKDDPSWYSYGIATEQIANYAGLFGAYAASFLVYFCGAASWVLMLVCSFMLYVYIMQYAVLGYKKRIGAGLGLFVASAALLHLFFAQTSDLYYAGGYVGYFIVTFALWYASSFYISSIALGSWMVCAMIMFNGDYKRMVTCVWSNVRRLCSYATCVRVHVFTYNLIWIISLPFKWCYWAIQKCIEGEDDIIEPNMISAEPAAQVHDMAYEYATVPEQSETDYDEHLVSYESQDSEELTPPTGYLLPNLDIFIGNKEERDNTQVLQHVQERALLLEQKLQRFGITGKVVSIKRGPVVTLFEYEPHIDSKISKIISLEDDLALALQALSIRIIAPIPGKPYVGFEVSNTQRKNVSLAQVLRSDLFAHFDGYLPLAIGQDTIGNTVIVDLVRMPHLLVAGSTGSGKSVALNSMLVSLLCKLTPDQLRLILIDPKRLEFASYADIAHLLFPIVTQPQKAAPVLKWVVQQMEERYERMAHYGARNIQDYNALMDSQKRERLPFIVLIIDELADLMMTAGREIEDLIARIAQMARASGIHLIVATQRPSVDVITGLIKVNFPSRISFRVTSKVDSRTILDCSGADKLLGRGDMLFLDAQDACLKRLHGAYVSDAEIDQLVTHIKQQRQVDYISLDDLLQASGDEGDKDELYQEVLAYLDEVDEVSISLLQRKFRIGYNRSARIIEMLEMQGLIGPSGNGKTRTVIRL